MVPVVFRTPRTLGALNVCAVGLAIAAVTTAAFTLFGADPRIDWSITAGLPTVVAGIAWAALLRSRDKFGSSNIPLGFAALSGGAAIVVAGRREAIRRRFVARVVADEVPGFRVETRTSGKVLVRVESKVETYRVVPPPDEELFELDEEGRALHAVDGRAHRTPT